MRDKYSQWVNREVKKVQAEIRAGKDPEQVIGWDWRFGAEVLKRGWKGPLLIIILMNVYDYGRMYADTAYCFKRLAVCKNYDQLGAAKIMHERACRNKRVVSCLFWMFLFAVN